jgi:hypothetical protein
MPIDTGYVQDRIGAALADPPAKTLVYHDVHRSRAMGAGGRDLDVQRLVSEAPLHEGRDKGVLRSGTRDALARAEAEAVRRSVGSHGEGPAHVAASVADQEEEAGLHVVEQARYGAQVHLQGSCDLGGGQRPLAVSRELANQEVSDGVVLRGHECEPIIHVS